MRTDTLNRRIRFAPPQPIGKAVVMTERDYAIFDALDRHGPLPSNLLYDLTKHLGRDPQTFKDRLTKLYNGAEDGRTYLTRPPQQFAAYDARYQPMVHDLTPAALVLLAERRTKRSAPRSDAFHHRLMSACIMASLELEATQRGLKFIHREEILDHPRCPEDTRDADDPLRIPVAAPGMTAITPDDLFGLDYGTGFRFFAIEIDRKTEAIERRDMSQNAFGRKIQGYLDILRNRTYRSHFGLPNLTILTVTTSPVHAENIMRYLKRMQEPLAERFLFKADPHFGPNWRIPRAPLANLLEPWARLGGTYDIGQV